MNLGSINRIFCSLSSVTHCHWWCSLPSLKRAHGRTAGLAAEVRYGRHRRQRHYQPALPKMLLVALVPRGRRTHRAARAEGELQEAG